METTTTLQFNELELLTLWDILEDKAEQHIAESKSWARKGEDKTPDYHEMKALSLLALRSRCWNGIKEIAKKNAKED